MRTQADLETGRAHPRFSVEGLCEARIRIGEAHIVLPVRNLSAGGFAADRPPDFGIDKSIERGVRSGLAFSAEVRVLDQLIAAPTEPVYRIASHTGFRFGPLSAETARTLRGTLQFMAIGAAMAPIVRPLGSEAAGWTLLHGAGPGEIWVATGDGGLPRVRLSYRDARLGSLVCRFEDGRFLVQTLFGPRDGRTERRALSQVLLILAGAAAREPSLRAVVDVGMRSQP